MSSVRQESMRRIQENWRKLLSIDTCKTLTMAFWEHASVRDGASDGRCSGAPVRCSDRLRYRQTCQHLERFVADQCGPSHYSWFSRTLRAPCRITSPGMVARPPRLYNGYAGYRRSQSGLLRHSVPRPSHWYVPSGHGLSVDDEYPLSP